MARKRFRNTPGIEQHINQVAYPSQSDVLFAQSAKQQKGVVNATTPSPIHPKVARLSRQSRETAAGTRIPINRVLLREPTSRP